MNKKILEELRARFPWLGNAADEDVNGGDQVDALNLWYEELVNKCEPKGRRKRCTR